MKKLISIVLILVSLIVFEAAPVSADSGVVSSSGQIVRPGVETNDEFDFRVVILRRFFKKYNSPLYPYADEFVETADKYGLDWRLVPAITGVESTFGKRIPYNSYNAYGWANGAYNFESWDESIEVVSSTLRYKYIDRGAYSVDQIGRIYAPPSSTWAYKVKFFMRRIDRLPLSFSLDS